jgi:hypothetical protein
MPDFDFDAYNHDQVESEVDEVSQIDASEDGHASGNGTPITSAVNVTASTPASNSSSTEEVDKW